MTTKSARLAIKDALEDLTEKKLKKFRAALLDRRGEPRVKTNAVDGKDLLTITDVLVSTFTASRALQVTVELLKEIGCNDEAQRLEMPPKTIKAAIKDALEDLTEKKLNKFRAALLDRRGDKRVKTNAVEGQDFLVIADALVSTFTESGALQVTVELLTEIGCNEEAKKLGQDTRGLSTDFGECATASPTEAKKQRQDDEDVYRVDEKSFRSRLALLIVNRDFDDPDMTRYGAEKDEQNMEHLLKELGYKVFKYTNLSGQEIDKAVKEFSQLPGLSQTDSVFVVIMSHGNLGVIHGIHWMKNNPDEFCIENIYKHLNSENCPALVNKPKVVIIQACRGKKDGSVFISDGDSAIMASDCEPQPSQADDMVEDGFRTHKEKDFISLLSCTPDTVSYRRPQFGSLLIEYMADEFKKFCREDHIEELFRKVMKRFEKFPCVDKRQMPTKDRCTLTNRFYLFPRP
ncbi:caspase-13-like [Myripristis murdjan]|uniref:caspase-13-like n=1 Tax=Myripristis murdjan TaxID=586833 RepID=UPI00117621E8|nr:caspase-13-like [Myripristis murdjan]